MSKLTTEQQSRCEQLFPIVGKYASHFCERHGVGDHDSVESAMIEGLVRATQSATLEESYAKTCMWNAAVDWLRSEGARNSESLTVDTPYDNDPLQCSLDREVHGKMMAAIKTLPDDERFVVNQRLHGKSFRDMSQEDGRGWAVLRTIFNSALRKIRLSVGVT